MTTAWLGVLLWQVVELIEDYRIYETNMSIETKVQSGMDFPEVAICNANPYNAEKVNASGVPKNEYGTPLPSSPEEMSNLTQPLENFIFDSRFNGEQVNIAQHWKPFITNEQICFQFQTDELVRRPGASGGLFVTARTNSIGNLATAGFFGVRVYISQQGATEVNQQHYTLAQPNAFHSRSIQRDVVELETRDPWSRCIFSAPNYTQPKCQQQCRADQVANTCKCREFVDTGKCFVRSWSRSLLVCTNCLFVPLFQKTPTCRIVIWVI